MLLLTYSYHKLKLSLENDNLSWLFIMIIYHIQNILKCEYHSKALFKYKIKNLYIVLRGCISLLKRHNFCFSITFRCFIKALICSSKIFYIPYLLHTISSLISTLPLFCPTIYLLRRIKIFFICVHTFSAP